MHIIIKLCIHLNTFMQYVFCWLLGSLKKIQVNNYHNMTDNTRDDGFSSKICIPIQTSFLSSPSLPSSLPISPILHKSEKQIINKYTLSTNYWVFIWRLLQRFFFEYFAYSSSSFSSSSSTSMILSFCILLFSSICSSSHFFYPIFRHLIPFIFSFFPSLE